jgi:thermitase
MIKISRTMGVIAAAIMLLIANSATATNFTEQVENRSGEYLVKYKNEKAVNNIVSMQTESSGIQVLGIHKVGNLLKIKLNKNNKQRALAAIYSDKNVEYVVPNFTLRAFSAPVELAALREQYALTKVNAEKAWTRAGNKGNRSVTVAVIDTGVDYKHPNLAPNMVAGYDFKDKDSDPMDLTSAQNPGHGSHCAGIIGATGLVDGGTSGLSPEVSIMPLRFLGADGGGDLNDGIKAIDYAIEKKVQVISASWGAAVPLSTAQPLVEAIQRAEKAGIIFVVAAANDGKNNDTSDYYPTNADVANVIAVAASNAQDQKPSWSNYGRSKVAVAAPGDAIMSTLPSNKYGNLSGTSMATPLVAGLVAFLKAQDPTLTAQEIKALMQSTGAQVSIETACRCRVDAFAAVDALLTKKPFLVPSAATVAVNATTQVALKNAVGAVEYASSDAGIASVSSAGLVTGLKEGTVTITATNNGAAIKSLDFIIGKASSGNDPDPGQPGDCPLGDPALCDAICQIVPSLPICQ